MNLNRAVHFKGTATRKDVARRIGEEILRIYDSDDSPFVPVTFWGDKVVDENGEYTYREFAEQILDL